MRPGAYFRDNPNEARLAEVIWDRAPTYQLKGLEAATKLPWASTRVIKAGGLAIEMRHVPTAVKGMLGTAYDACNAAERANVEHFWCGAVLGNVGGPFGLVGGAFISFAYDGIISPLSKVLDGRDFDKMVEGVKYDLAQFSGPDLNGVKFGAIYHQRYFWQ